MNPHVFVQYKRGETRAKDAYNYGIVGSMPISQLVGFIIRIQAELAFRSPAPCDECACIISYDPVTGTMSWAVDSSIPVDELVGSLELIKCQLVDSQMAALAQAMLQRQQTGLVNQSGQPIMKEKFRGS